MELWLRAANLEPETVFLVKAILVKDIVATTVAYNDAKKSVERCDLTHFTNLIHIKKLYQGHVRGQEGNNKEKYDPT